MNRHGNIIIMVQSTVLKARTSPPTSHIASSRCTVKVSYSCMQSLTTIINQHNSMILRLKQQANGGENDTGTCNCRKKGLSPLNFRHPSSVINQPPPQKVFTCTCRCSIGASVVCAAKSCWSCTCTCSLVVRPSWSWFPALICIPAHESWEHE